MGRVQGKVALVTGGRRGIGKAVAILLAGEGAKVVITDRKPEGSEAVIEAIEKTGGDAVFLEQDVAKEADWKRAIDQTLERLHRGNKTAIKKDFMPEAPARTSKRSRSRIGAGS